MPGVLMFGRNWRVSSDFIPLFALIGLCFHLPFTLLILIWPIGIGNEQACETTAKGRQYLAVGSIFCILYGLAVIQEVLLILIGIRGTPLEVSKRKWMIPVLYAQFVNWTLQLIVEIWATITVALFVPTACWEQHYAILGIKITVYASWGMQAFNWLRVLVLYNVFPAYEDVASWAKRIKWYSALTSGREVISHLKSHRQRPLNRLADLYSSLLHGADLSPSDEVVSIILLSAMQRKRRRAHIARKLEEWRRGQRGSLELVSSPGPAGGSLRHRLQHHEPPEGLGQQQQPRRQQQQPLRAPPPDADAGAPSRQHQGEASVHSQRQVASELGDAYEEPEQQQAQPQRQAPRRDVRQRMQRPTPQQRAGLGEGAAKEAREAEHEAGGSRAVATVNPEQVIAIPKAAQMVELQPVPCAQQRAQAQVYLQQRYDETSGEEGDKAGPDLQALNEKQERLQEKEEQQRAQQAQQQRPRGQHAPAGNGLHPGDRDVAQQQPHQRQSSGAQRAEATKPSDSEGSSLESGSSGDTGKGGGRAETGVDQQRDGDAWFGDTSMLCPSLAGIELCPGLPPDQVADIYTGHHERVDRDTLVDAARFAKYAIAAYGSAGYTYLRGTRKTTTTFQLLNNRGRNAYKANALLRDKIKTLEQHLDYEAIVQVAEIEDQDVLYLNFENQALGDLPYIIALDRPTKSVVVSIRGTVSMADLATDLMAEPRSMEEWLPESMKQEPAKNSRQGPELAHAGIMAAATAIWRDLRNHRILPALLDISPDDEPDQDSAEFDIGVGDKDGLEEVCDAGRQGGPAGMEELERDAAKSRKHLQGRSDRRAAKRHASDAALQLPAGSPSPAKKPPQRRGHATASAPAALARQEGPGSEQPGRGGLEHNGASSPGIPEEPHQVPSRSGQAGGVNTAGECTSNSTAEGITSRKGEAEALQDRDAGQEEAAAQQHHKGGKSKSLSKGSSRQAGPGQGRMSKSGGPFENTFANVGRFAVDVVNWRRRATSKQGRGPNELPDDPRRMDRAHRDIETGQAGQAAEAARQEGPASESASGSEHGESASVGQSGANGHIDPVSAAQGSQAVADFGAANPKAAAGHSHPGDEASGKQRPGKAGADEKNFYAADIIRRGLNKEGWSLVITGHSLGAGAAALITLKLRDRYPRTRCWAYCPPGGLLTASLAHAMEPFCTSVAIGKDAIPRMSLKNLNRFFEGKIGVLACSKLSAWSVFLQSYGKLNRRRFFEQDIFRPMQDVPEEARAMLDKFRERRGPDFNAIDLYPPGRMIYMRRFKASPLVSVTQQVAHADMANHASRRPVTESSSTAGASAQELVDVEAGRQQGQVGWPGRVGRQRLVQLHLTRLNDEAQGSEAEPLAAELEEPGDQDEPLLRRWWRRRQRQNRLQKDLAHPTELFWDAIWIQPEEIISEGILVSPKMTADHYTTSILRSLKAAIERLSDADDSRHDTQASSHINSDASPRRRQGHTGREHLGDTAIALGSVFDLV